MQAPGNDWDGKFEEDAQDISSMPSILFINEAEKASRFLRALGRANQSNDRASNNGGGSGGNSGGGSDLNSSLRSRGPPALRRAYTASTVSSAASETPREEIQAVTQCVQIVGSHIRDLSSLFDASFCFPQLLHLNLSFNSLRDLPSLSTCPNLRTLDISHNKFSNVDFVWELTEIRILRLHHNSVESLYPLQQLGQLEELWLGCNNVDFTQFLYLSACSKLAVLIKASNPCDEKPKILDYLCNILPSLRIVDQQVLDETRSAGNLTGRANDESVDVKVMITQARAQLKREASAHNGLSLDSVGAAGAGEGAIPSSERARTSASRSHPRRHGLSRDRTPRRAGTAEQSEDDSSSISSAVVSEADSRHGNHHRRHRVVQQHKREKNLSYDPTPNPVDASAAEGRPSEVHLSSQASKKQTSSILLPSRPTEKIPREQRRAAPTGPSVQLHPQHEQRPIDQPVLPLETDEPPQGGTESDSPGLL